MWIWTKTETNRNEIFDALTAIQEKSRFTFELSRETHPRHTRGRPGIQIRNVRLRHKKPYCGAHPGECLVTPFQKAHPVCRYLEGLDWVGFNAMLNDVLDRLGSWAVVFSYNRECARGGPYYVRRGFYRLTYYPTYGRATQFGTAYLWTQPVFHDHYANCVGKPPPEDRYPSGPGRPTWRRLKRELSGVGHDD